MIYVDAVLPAGEKRQLHVNQHCLGRNARNPTADLACVSVKHGRRRAQNYYCRTAYLHGPSSCRQSMRCPLACGARVWIETEGAVEVAQNAAADAATRYRIHISKTVIRANLKEGADHPCIRLVEGDQVRLIRGFDILGPAVVVQTRTSIYIATDADVVAYMDVPAVCETGDQPDFFSAGRAA